MSGMCRRDHGHPQTSGELAARALTATTTSGGKGRGPAAPWALVEPGEALLVEAFSPFRDDLPPGVEASCDLVVVHAAGGQKDDLGRRTTSRYGNV